MSQWRVVAPDPMKTAPRLVVCGGRDFTDKDFVFRTLDRLTKNLPSPLLVVVGDAKGVDALAVEWALSRRHFVSRWYAEWGKYGKRAGPMRNAELVGFAGERRPAYAICFPGGRGTADCRMRCENAAFNVRVVRR